MATPALKPTLSATDFSSMVTALTSAFGDPTRREIYLFARDSDEGVTASEVARRFDLHPNVARHHLDKLAAGGYVEVAVARTSPTGAGRPSKHYRSTAKADTLEIPVRHDDVLVLLLGRALAMLDPASAETMAEEVGEEYGRVLAASMGDATDSQRSVRSAMQAVADALTAQGFAAHASARNDELRIVNDHCPFGEAAASNPVLCAVDRGMVRGLVSELLHRSVTETAVQLESSKALGDDRCVTAVDAGA
jgi:predicted ArsR family transcriptional regulator